MDELERLEKAVVDTKASFDASFDAAAAWDDAADAWFKAKRELSNYLEEQDK
tara:strand:+ start:452 stop:607 length:156 start_codon:yes stop_codon:yes gene_type:complete